MKIALICPSNMLYMPYVYNYIHILKENNINHNIINWDRFGIEKDSELTYRDSKVGHKRTLFDYYKFKKFIIKLITEVNYDKVIIFGIQLSFFLSNILQRKYKENYIIDIRDRNKIVNYFNIAKIINHSEFTVLSSLGYKEWLPKCDKYIINHNTKINSLDKLEVFRGYPGKKRITISCIGAIRDCQVNIDFIKSLKNSKGIDLYFHGEGDINKEIQKYLDDNKIKNVSLSGRYEREEEINLYKNSDLINVLRYNDGINNKTALPNRLYNAVIYGKPMIAFEGTHLSEEIERYELGLVLSSLDKVEMKIKDYITTFNDFEYQKNRVAFLKGVLEENAYFEKRLIDFVQQ